mgnify:CR=1 FL=1
MSSFRECALFRAKYKQLAQGQLRMDAFTDNTHFLAYLETKPNDPTLCPSALFALNIATCFSNRFVKENKGFIRSGLSTELACTAQAEKVGMHCNKPLCKSHQHSTDTAHPYRCYACAGWSSCTLSHMSSVTSANTQQHLGALCPKNVSD